jgi:hypothetical protein
MRRAVTLVACLVALALMVASRGASAQYYGPNVHIWAVGSSRYPTFEFISEGQTTTRNPQAGGWIEVYVWQPAGSNSKSVSVHLDNSTQLRIASTEVLSTWWGAVSGYLHHAFISMGEFQPKTIDVTYVTQTWPARFTHLVLSVRQP